MEIPKKEFEDIIDQKVEKRLRKRKQRTGREAEIRTETPVEESDSSLSRRGFLKAAGLGAVGLGAAAMIGNASAFRINSDQGLSYFNRSSNQSQFNVSSDGILDVKQIGTVKNPVESVHSETINTQELSANTELIKMENQIVHTQPNDTISDVNTLLSSLGINEHLSIDYPLSINGEGIIHPPNTTIFVRSRVYRPDAANNVTDTTTGSQMISNTDRTTSSTDSNLKLIFDGGCFDGNSQNQDSTLTNWFSVDYRNADDIEIHNLDVRNNCKWACAINNCDGLRISGAHIVSNGSHSHQDGVHITDCKDVYIEGVSGTSGDDLMAITRDERDLSQITVCGVTGSSIDANGLRLNIPTAKVGDGVNRVFSDINIKGLNIHNTGGNGVVMQNSDANTTYENVCISGIIDTPTDMGYQGLSGGGTMLRCKLDLIIKTPSNDVFNLESADNAEDCVFNVRSHKTSDPRPAILAQNLHECELTVHSRHDSTTNPNVVILSGSENRISGHLVGGTRGVQLGTGTSATSGTIVSDIIIEDTGSQAIYEVDADDDYNLITDYQIVNCTSGIALNGANSIDTGDGIVR